MEGGGRSHSGHKETIGNGFMGIYVQSNQITMCQLSKKENVYVLNHLLLWSGLYLSLTYLPLLSVFAPGSCKKHLKFVGN